MAQRAPKRESPPAEVLANLTGGYDGYTAPTVAPWNRWAASSNIFAGAFGYLQRARFASIYTQAPTSTPYTTLRYYAIPGTGAYLLGDQNGKLYSYDTGASYAQTQRLSPYWDPSGTGTSLLNGPWMRETLQNIIYEMNGQVKQTGRGANAATIEGWGLDAPDTSPQIGIGAGLSATLTSLQRQQGIVTGVSAATSLIVPGTSAVLNVTGVTDTSFNGSFLITETGSGGGPFTYTWSQLGQNVTLGGGFGSITASITKAVGRSYAFAWENANKNHVGAPGPASQYVQYVNQFGVLALTEVGGITSSTSSPTVTGTNTQFTSAWIGRSIVNASGVLGRIIAVTSATQLTLAANAASVSSNAVFLVWDPQATHIRLYATADGGATYFRIARNSFNPALGLTNANFTDYANAEPPAFPFTTEVAQANNVPPPIGPYINEYQGRIIVFGIPGVLQSFFYSNVETTTIGLQQESFAPLNQVTLPIQNAQVNGMVELPGDMIIWSDKQDMFRLTGLLTDNVVGNTAPQQGASIARLPYNIGIANPFACDITPLGAFWLSSNNEIWLFTDRYAPRNIGRPVQDILTSISPAGLKLARMKYYHSTNRNWLAVSVAANGGSANNTVLILDLDLLASNGSPSYFTFDMATNAPSWYVYKPVGGRCDSLEVVYETGGLVRLVDGQVDLIQDLDFNLGGTGTEVTVPGAGITTHAWGNDTPFVLKRPGWFRFNTNRDPSMMASDGWTFSVDGIDDDFYTFFSPLTLTMTPGGNDTSTLGGNPAFATSGLAFRHSPELYRVGGVNFVMGRRLKFTVNFPSGTGVNYQLRFIELGFGALPAS